MRKKTEKGSSGAHLVGTHGYYKPEFCREIVEYFVSFKHTIKGAKGRTTLQAPFSFVKFALKIGVRKQTLDLWRQKYPEFAEAHAWAKLIYEEIMIDGAIMGHYNPHFAKLIMANRFGWVDKKEVDITGTMANVSEAEIDKKIRELMKKVS